MAGMLLHPQVTKLNDDYPVPAFSCSLFARAPLMQGLGGRLWPMESSQPKSNLLVPPSATPAIRPYITPFTRSLDFKP